MLETRNSRSRVFCKKGFLEVLQNHSKTPVPGSLFNKVIGLRLGTVFSWESCEISEDTFIYRTPLVAASVQLY